MSRWNLAFGDDDAVLSLPEHGRMIQMVRGLSTTWADIPNGEVHVDADGNCSIIPRAAARFSKPIEDRPELVTDRERLWWRYVDEEES